MHIGYFTIQKSNHEQSIDWDWINSQKIIKQEQYTKLIELNNELLIIIDGHNGKGVIQYNTRMTNDLMDEELSTGI